MILLVFRLVLLAVLLALLIIPHILFKAVTGRGAVGRLFLKWAAWIMGIRAHRIGPAPTPQTLIVANHVSWLDILVLGGTLGSAFVSKAEVKQSAFLKWLADQRETLYVDRQARRDIAQQVAAVRRRFDHYLPLAVFPEGTTNDGKSLKRFRPALFGAVIPAPEGAKLVPVAIDYRDDATFVAWHGDEGGLANFKRVLSRWQPIHVDIRMLDPLDPSENRKLLAARASAAIADALGLGAPNDYSPAP
ncbi:MAG: 1-acyl-sn-glycerol-3-phosphate acyltransferase [Sphingomonas sp.]|nr:1-acyl-sn-glycerol-3-phosphate acyltransferase [Sphingomonas sp.]RZV53015.1 MAG: 1-acyl-sn-glycerol-3-phosphate acyltransferase [Sphingomonadaceae bacterium]